MYSALAKDWLIRISGVCILYNDTTEEDWKKKLIERLLHLRCGYDYEKSDWNGEGEQHDHNSMEKLILSTFNGLVAHDVSRWYGEDFDRKSSHNVLLDSAISKHYLIQVNALVQLSVRLPICYISLGMEPNNNLVFLFLKTQFLNQAALYSKKRLYHNQVIYSSCIFEVRVEHDCHA